MNMTIEPRRRISALQYYYIYVTHYYCALIKNTKQTISLFDFFREEEEEPKKEEKKLPVGKEPSRWSHGKGEMSK